MAQIMTKRGNIDNIVTYEFVCDTLADLQTIDPQYITMGSVATVISGSAGFEVYMANSQKEWVNIGGGGSNNSGSSEPVWVNQDIIVSVPETVSYEDNGETHYYATNMLLNNHVIQGNIVPNQVSDVSTGYFTANINPSLTTSFIDMYQSEPELNQEYYIACILIPASMYNIQIDTINTLIIPTPVVPVSAMSAIEGLDGDVVFQITNTSDTLYIYKIPGYVISQNSNPLLLHYLFSSLQPEATYDISQLTYETPQAGE